MMNLQPDLSSLISAVEANSLELVILLITAGVDPNAENQVISYTSVYEYSLPSIIFFNDTEWGDSTHGCMLYWEHIHCGDVTEHDC